jgi:enoyl-CoA hydratase/carnithine racemase
MWGDLSEIFLELDRDKDIRSIVLTGAGDKSFSAGADIQDFELYRSDSIKGLQYNLAVDNLLQTLSELKTPTISMIRGFAAGGGCEIAVATDIRIATEKSKIGIPVAKLGITIGHREMNGLINLVGKGNALYILLSGRLIESDRALGMGLVTQVVLDEELESTTYQLAKEIAELAPLSHAVNKQTLNQVLANPSLSNLSDSEKALPLKQFDTRDYKEGCGAFLEKRKPIFLGE